jgi:hypothetical protein
MNSGGGSLNTTSFEIGTGGLTGVELGDACGFAIRGWAGAATLAGACPFSNVSVGFPGTGDANAFLSNGMLTPSSADSGLSIFYLSFFTGLCTP